MDFCPSGEGDRGGENGRDAVECSIGRQNKMQRLYRNKGSEDKTSLRGKHRTMRNKKGD